MVQMPDSLPSKRRMLAYIAVFFIARLFWKIGKFVHHILTSVNQSSIVHHNCTPPNDYKHQPVTQQSTLALIKEKYPELVGLVESGNLIAFQPQKVLKQILDDQNKQENGHQGLTTVEDVEQLMSSNRLQACMSAPVPELMFVLGTVHVSKQSGEDVKKLIKAIQPSVVVIELCQQRMQALLLDPYDNPLTDLEPSAEKLAQHTAMKHKGVIQIMQAAVASRDHNVLFTMLSGMYSKFEEKLEVRAGVEFIAARQALIEMLQEQHQQATASGDHKQHQQRQQEQDGTSSAEEQQHQQLGPGTTGPADDEGLQQQQRRQQVTWLNKVVPGDRSVTDTILGLWGSLGPWRRLHFIWDLLQALGEDIDEETIKALANEDMVELLLKEFSDTYPEAIKPLLHDRNWVLATNTWHVAQQAAQQEGPVVAVVGKGHLGGMVYVFEQLVQLFANLGGMPCTVL